MGSLTPTGIPLEVAAGLIFRNGKLLITQRRNADHLGGLWEFPGGKREGNESFEACLVRELKEELGLDVQTGQLIETVIHHYPGKSVCLKFFKCSCEAGDPQPLACQAIAWIGPDEIDRYEFPAADARLLEKLKSAVDLWR